MSRITPDNLADALDEELAQLREILNRGLDALAQLRQVARDLRTWDSELGTMQDALCDWHDDKQRRLK